MKINPYAGVLYDLIAYNLIHFNKDTMRQAMSLYSVDDDETFRFYNEFVRNKNVVTPEDSLYPFFYYEVGKPCVLSKYFGKNFDFFDGTFEDFFKLFENTHQLKRFVFYYYLEGHQKEVNIEAALKGDKVEIGKALVCLSKHGSRQATFVQLFFDFDSVYHELQTYLKKLFPSVKQFHEKRKDMYRSVANEFLRSDKLSVFLKNMGVPKKVEILEQTYTVSFFNQYMVHFEWKNERQDICIIIGYLSKFALEKKLYYSLSNADPTMVCQILSHGVMRDIIHVLSREELTITQLSMRLPVSRTSMDRLVGILHDSSAIVIAHTSGNEKYYTINPTFFVAGKKALNNEIDNILLDCRRKL